MKKVTSRVATAIMLVLFLILSGCSASSSKQGTSEKEKPKSYVVGMILPQTGNSAAYGLDQITAVQMAIDDVNKSGGVNGVPLEFKVEDSQGDPQRAITAYNKLAKVDKVPFIISGFSSVVKALAPLSDRDKVAILAIGVNDVTIRGAAKHTISSYPYSDIDLPALAKYTIETLGKKKAAVIYINNPSGKPGAEVYRDKFKEYGGEVVAFESHEPNALDFKSQLTKIKAANPDVIHIESLVKETPYIVKQIRELGISAQITSYSAAENQVLIDTAGKASEGLIYTSLAPDLTSGKASEFINRFKQSVGREPNGISYTLYMYDSVTVIKKAIEYIVNHNMEYNGTNMVTAIQEVGTFDTPITGNTIIKKDGNVIKPIRIRQITNGKFVNLTTINP